MALHDLKGKVALVTGGGSGICLEFTKQLLSAGCNVVIADRQLLPEAEKLISQWKEGRVVYQKTEVTDWSQLQAAFDAAMKQFGRLDIVCPGAGIFEPPTSTFWGYGTKDSKDTNKTNSFEIFDINVNHPIRAAQLALDYFMRQKKQGTGGQGKGVVVMIASVAAQMTLLPVPLYCASKHAIGAFTRSMELLEPSLGVRINAVAPGVVKTPLWNPNPDRLDWVDESVDKWITTTQVAEAMMDLITKDEYVGGTVLEVGADKLRKVGLLNDAGPQGAGHTLQKIGKGFEDVFPMIEKNFGN